MLDLPVWGPSPQEAEIAALKARAEKAEDAIERVKALATFLKDAAKAKRNSDAPEHLQPYDRMDADRFDASAAAILAALAGETP